MRYRTFGRLGWQVSEIGYGTWGMGGWTGFDEEASVRAIERAIALGCNFFDTAWVYGGGTSERVVGRTVVAARKEAERPLFIASKIPPKNMKWPASDAVPVADTFPPDHIREYTEKSLETLGIDTVDLQQFHVWSDTWADDDGWQRAIDDLKREKLVYAIGISVNRGEPANVMRALATGLIDSVQVVYNVFDQAPEDELLPFCQDHGIAVIARVPFDEGSLTGALTADSSWPQGDFRNNYFNRDNLTATLERVERLKPLVPERMDMPELALRFILDSPTVSTIIPGMRTAVHVERNIGASDGEPLPPRLREALRAHRWDRAPRPS